MPARLLINDSRALLYADEYLFHPLTHPHIHPACRPQTEAKNTDVTQEARTSADYFRFAPLVESFGYSNSAGFQHYSNVIFLSLVMAYTHTHTLQSSCSVIASEVYDMNLSPDDMSNLYKESSAHFCKRKANASQPEELGCYWCNRVCLLQEKEDVIID